jgi:hypothetical protein
MLVVCTIRVCLESLKPEGTRSSPGLQERQLQGGNRDEAYPGVFFDLWPYDKNTEEYRDSLKNCYPEDDGTTNEDQQKTDCQVTLFPDNNGNTIKGQLLKKRVALVRPPGRLGDVFVEFVTRVVRLHEHQDDGLIQIEVIPITQQQALKNNNKDQPPEYSMIIRLATLPVLLQAADIALTLQEEEGDDTPPLLSLSMKDLMELMQYEIRWQCHMNHKRDIAMLTITLDRFMGSPISTTQQLQMFLDLPTTVLPNNKQQQSRKKINMDDLSLIVTDRVDKGSALVEELANNKNKLEKNTRTQQVQDLRNLVDQEVAASQGGNNCLPLPSFGNRDMQRRLKWPPYFYGGNTRYLRAKE